MNFTPTQSRLLIDIARQVIVAKVTGRPVELSATATDLATDQELLAKPAGCFVTLHEIRTHRLRGCIGRIEADRPMFEAVQTAALATLDDPRFVTEPVTLDELPKLEVEISLLSPLQPAATPLNFNPLNDGIVLTISDRRGLFLPQVARETGWTKQQLLARLCLEKLNLPADAWQDESATLETFSTAIVGPERLLNLDQKVTS